MNWSVTRGLFKSTVHCATKTMGLSVYRKGGAYSIVDDSRKTVFTVTPRDGLSYSISGSSGVEGTGKLTLADNAPAFFPRRAVRLDVSLGDASYNLVQEDNRDITVYSGGETLGKITGILQRDPKLSLPDRFGSVNAALLYTLSLIMLHEDDLAVV